MVNIVEYVPAKGMLLVAGYGLLDELFLSNAREQFILNRIIITRREPVI